MAPHETTYEFFATCSKGVEKVLAQELTALAQGCQGARPPDNLQNPPDPDNPPPVILGLSQNPPDGDSRRTHKTPQSGGSIRWGSSSTPPSRLKIRPLNSGVAFFGTLVDAYRALLHLSVASRVLLILARVDANDAEQLYAQVRALPWEEHIAATGTLAVDARGTSDELRDTRFVAQKVK
ncbi:MAG: hypothetical protein LBC23_05530, partial [Coriobacteriales bacterium]|nr:hypothetical protein [Coriobacteriales bacterium]